ncbi:hypothetical protein LVJ94_04540 [Pendulispora rubella]|uniref:Lipoprotein n=1 Tax=Pendulispora rubella TaxID=2741070 RepID=A0ABZ2L6W1_9BACT
MKRALALGAFLVGALLGTACGKAPGTSAPTPDSCDGRRETAQKQVQDTIEYHLQCSTDNDCTQVPFATLCFDSCTRAVNTQGVSAVREAVARVDQTVCATYEQDHCPLIHPPCLPATAICKHGYCR